MSESGKFYKYQKRVWLYEMDHISEKGFLDEDYEEARWREKERKAQDVPIEYWTIQKLVKFMKIGNQVVTNACLCCIRDYDLTKQLNQRAIFSIGGLETLVNLCKSNDLVCRFGALYVLREMSTNIDMRRYMIDMNIIESLCKIITEPLHDIKCLAIDILGILANIKPARQIIHKSDVVNKIIDGLNFDRTLLKKSTEEMTPKEVVFIDLAVSASKALSTILTSMSILSDAKKGGLILSISELLKTVHVPLIRAVLRLCSVCSHDIVIQLGLESEMVIVDVAKQLASQDQGLLTDACGIVAQCGKSPKTSKLVQKFNGLKQIVNILSREEYWQNNDLMLAATAAAYTCATHRDNALQFNKLRVLPLLTQFLTQRLNDDILANICGFASQLLYQRNFVDIFLKNDALKTILDFFYIEHDTLRIENCHVLTKVCKYPEYAHQMRTLDGITFLWSLLRSGNPLVQTAASNALCEYLQNDDRNDSAEYLRKLDNGLELIASSLKSKNEVTLNAICSLIVEIAKDTYNLAILTQYQVVPLLADLIHTENKKIEEKVTAAIAACTPYAENAKQFGELKVIRLIVNLVTSGDQNVRRAAAMALAKLSAYPINAILMYQSGVVPVLLEDILSDDAVLRHGAANCLRNLRELTLEAEQFLMMKLPNQI